MTLSDEIRRHVIEQSKRANVGHIGSALSIADMLAALYGGALDVEADRFVLSKGHAALALYAALTATGQMERSLLETYCTDGTALGAHPEHVVDGVHFSTGSLGHGLSIGAGVALGSRLRRQGRRAFVLMSDAECNEGSVWEAVMFAAHHRLGNLVALVDVNGQQALGRTKDVLDCEPLGARWEAFGWDVHEVDGHDVEGMRRTIAELDVGGSPHVLLCRTTFGRGVSFMESKIAWHYLPLDDDQYTRALTEISA